MSSTRAKNYRVTVQGRVMPERKDDLIRRLDSARRANETLLCHLQIIDDGQEAIPDVTGAIVALSDIYRDALDLSEYCEPGTLIEYSEEGQIPKAFIVRGERRLDIPVLSWASDGDLVTYATCN